MKIPTNIKVVNIFTNRLMFSAYPESKMRLLSHHSLAFPCISFTASLIPPARNASSSLQHQISSCKTILFREKIIDFQVVNLIILYVCGKNDTCIKWQNKKAFLSYVLVSLKSFIPFTLCQTK